MIKEQRIIYQKEWRKKNPEKVKEYSEKQRKNHPEYKEKYKGRYTGYTGRYRRKMKEKYGLGAGTIARYGWRLALQVYEKFNRKCAKCDSEDDLTIHHLDGNGQNNEKKGLPMNNELDNLILICRHCHGSIHGREHGKNYKRK